jgi:hypothetical protein
MVEQENGFTIDQARKVRLQIQIENFPNSDFFFNLLKMTLLKRRIIPLEELYKEIVPFMQLEAAEKPMLSAGLNVGFKMASAVHHCNPNREQVENDKLDDVFKKASEVIKEQNNPDLNTALEWLKVTYESGINLAINIYDLKISSERLVCKVNDCKQIIWLRRNRVPSEIKDMTNACFLSANLL